MTESQNVIHSVEEERQRIAQIANNPRIVAAFRQAQNEGGIIDKLLDAFGYKVKERHEQMALGHLGADDRKLIEDFSASRFAPEMSQADMDTGRGLLRQAMTDMEKKLTAPLPPMPRQGRQL